MILWLYYIYPLSRIPKSPHLLFYDFSTIYYHFQSFSHKKKNRFAPRTLNFFSNVDSNKHVPICTIHMSLWFIVRSFPFIKFLREVPDVSWSRGRARERRFPAGKGGLWQRWVVGEHGGCPLCPRVEQAGLEMGPGGSATCVRGA